MALILGTFGDPALEEFFFGGGEFFVGVWRGHEVIGIGGEDAFDDGAGVRVAGGDGFGFDGVGADVEAEVAFAMVLIGPVAGVAVFGEDGSDVPVERDLSGVRGGGSEEEEGREAFHGWGNSTL
jgi:hypothetical protein